MSKWMALALIALAAPAWAAGEGDAVPGDTPGAPAASMPAELPPVAEIKPEDFVYVAATRPDRIGRVMAPVFVNGVGPFAFVVDTGASSSVISPRVVARLGIEPESR
jgi:predicted aspartyl protease